MLAGLVVFFLPLAVLVLAGFVAAERGARTARQWSAVLAVVSTVVWLVYVGLYQHEIPCDGHRSTGCPTVYGYGAPLEDDHIAGLLLLFAGFVVPAAWTGWRRRLPPLTAGASLAVGPTVLALWTAPRGDNDGLWALILFFLPLLGAVAAGVAAVAEHVRVARDRAREPDFVLTVAEPSDRLCALAIDVLIVGGALAVPLTSLSHAKYEVVAGVLGVGLATTYLAIPIAWVGRTLGQSLVGLLVVDSTTRERIGLGRALLRSLIVVLEVAAIPTLIFGIPAFADFMTLAGSGRSLTDRLFGTAVLSRTPAVDTVPAETVDSR